MLSLQFSLDQEILVSGSRDGSIRLWRVRDGSQMCWFTSNIAVLCARITDPKNALVALGDKQGRRKLILMQIVRFPRADAQTKCSSVRDLSQSM